MDLERIGTWCGIVSPAVGLLAVLAATVVSPSFSWATSALSDLGAPGEPTALLFNGGLFVSGVVGLGFGARVVVAADRRLEYAGAGAYVLAVVALALVALFPSGTALHGPAAVSYFGLFTFGLWLWGTGEALGGAVERGLATVWLGIAHVLAWTVWAAGLRPGDGIALPELAGAVVLAAWTVSTARRWLDRGHERAAEEPADAAN